MIYKSKVSLSGVSRIIETTKSLRGLIRYHGSLAAVDHDESGRLEVTPGFHGFSEQVNGLLGGNVRLPIILTRSCLVGLVLPS